MELQEFVKSAITQIINGLDEAHDAVKDSGAIVNPRNVSPLKEEFGTLHGHISNRKMLRAVHKLEFDVAVTASKGKETKGGIGVAIATIGLGASGKSDTAASMSSRIRFSVPIAYPEKE